MSRIPQVKYEEASPEIQKLWKETEQKYGSVSNMKAVLINSPEALNAALEWYALYNKIKPYLGERRIILFCNAISRENTCKLCSSYMNAALQKKGENPEDLSRDEFDKTIVDFGTQLARDANRIRESIFDSLKKHLNSAQIVELTIFGALMILNNVFNNALQVDLDESLGNYEVNPDIAFANSARYKKGNEQ